MSTQTAAQRRERLRAAHREAMAACPTQQVLDRLGDKWVPLVFKVLGAGPRRHGELARTIAGASQKMLTQTLRGLERDGLVSRSVTASVPARVDYTLTPLGRSLLPVLDALTRWADEHVPDITAARLAYDAADGDGHLTVR